jgi:hypothetical protein
VRSSANRWRCIAALAVAAGLALGALAADGALKTRLTGALPTGKEIGGWAVVPRSLVYGEGKGLTDIYDGGYKQYVDNGVVAAARQVYRKASLNAEVILHGMSSAGAGAKLARIKRADFSPGTVKDLKGLAKGWAGFTVQDSGYAVAYVHSGSYLATVVVDGKEAAAASAAEVARKAISKALAAEKAARKSRSRS